MISDADLRIVCADIGGNEFAARVVRIDFFLAALFDFMAQSFHRFPFY
jgi:hypothetical protein